MKKQQAYTEKLHAHRMKLMLRRKDPCGLCPKMKDFEIGFGRLLTTGVTLWEGDRSMGTGSCKVCQEFVGITRNCPCFALGKERAIKRTWLALEEKGYLK